MNGPDDHPVYGGSWAWLDDPRGMHRAKALAPSGMYRAKVLGEIVDTLTNNNPDYLHTDKEHPMSITPGELRGRLQPTILLRMTSAVEAAPGNTDQQGKVFAPGLVVFAQYIGNGRLLLTPVNRASDAGAHVVMASALNTTAEFIPQDELAVLFGGPAKD